MSLPSIPERVAAGVAWLDENVGPDWPERVALDDFRIESRCLCVLGFVFEDKAEPIPGITDEPTGFGHGLALLGKEKLESLGFDISVNDDTFGYFVLQAEWKRVIAERQASR